MANRDVNSITGVDVVGLCVCCNESLADPKIETFDGFYACSKKCKEDWEAEEADAPNTCSSHDAIDCPLCGTIM